jgi:hypothetical protein
MTIREAQDIVDQWINTTGVRYFNELTNMAILTEEVGEVARIISRRYGEQSEKESDEGKELGDELEKMGRSGRAYAEENCGRAVAVGRYHQELRSLAGEAAVQ